jgi:hypothetical protein
MKNVRMILSAFVILAVAWGALAFKTNAFNQGTIWCFNNSVISMVNQSEGCTVSGQPQCNKINFKIVTTGGSTTNPCLTGQTPFDCSNPNLCLETTLGTTKFASTPH